MPFRSVAVGGWMRRDKGKDGFTATVNKADAAYYTNLLFTVFIRAWLFVSEPAISARQPFFVFVFTILFCHAILKYEVNTTIVWGYDYQFVK